LYQQHVWSKGGKTEAAFNGTVDALQHLILGRLGTLYDDLTGGVQVECVGEDFWVNNVNIRSVLRLFCQRPTDAARTWLEGLREKLDLLLERRTTTTRDDAVCERAAILRDEISLVLSCTPTASPPRLCA
jgi:hypothetical protein